MRDKFGEGHGEEGVKGGFLLRCKKTSVLEFVS